MRTEIHLGESPGNSPYRQVGALERGLALIEELNAQGRATPARLALATGIDRTTVYRLLGTLMRLGYVAKSPSDGAYLLQSSVRNLSDGLTKYDRVSSIVSTEFARLLPQVQWPTDFAVFDRGWMVIRETTHRFSPYSVHRAMIGQRRPLLRSALGRATLAAAPNGARNEMLDIAMSHNALPFGRQMAEEMVGELMADFGRRGYAWSVGGTEVGISAIALPIRDRLEIRGAVNLVFFSSAMTPEQAETRFLGRLRAAVERISDKLGPVAERAPPAG